MLSFCSFTREGCHSTLQVSQLVPEANLPLPPWNMYENGALFLCQINFHLIWSFFVVHDQVKRFAIYSVICLIIINFIFSISSYTSLEREKNTLSKKKYFGRRKPIIFRHKKIKKHILHKNFLKFLKTVI